MGNIDYHKLLLKIVAKIKEEPREYRGYFDAVDCLVKWSKQDVKTPYAYAEKVLQMLNRAMSVLVQEKEYREAESFRQLRYALLKWSAPVNFDHYMQALEYDRPVHERFYYPRREILLHHVNALQRLADDQLDELFLSQPPRTGKALADDTPVLTRNGWKNHGDLVVGDEVIGLDGEFKMVIAVHPKCMLDVLMEFTNGEKIQCHENHEWLLFDHDSHKMRLEETKYYESKRYERGVPNTRGHRYKYQVPEHAYVVGEEKDLPIDPYTFGVWLGDGVNTNPTICNATEDYAIIERIIRNGNELRWETKHKDTGVMYYGFGFRSALRKYNMCHSKKRTPKHIPSDYLTASVEQRLDLLAGLIDTDGTFRRKENRYVFTTCEESLRDTFIELLATFGWRASVVTYEPIKSSSGVQGRKLTFCIGFNPDCEIPCALERKRNHVFSKKRAVALSKISRVEPKQGNCITVEGGVYLAGKAMIPTHNSTLVTFFYTWIIGRNPELANLYVSYSDSLAAAFYSGMLEIMQDKDTYKWQDIFETRKIASTNAKNSTFDVDRTKKYHSFTARSLYGSLNGSCDCTGILCGDDLLSGIEEALNPDRLATAWAHVDNNMLTRAKQSAKVLWIGTRWSIADPIGKRLDLLQTDPKFAARRYEVINIPALNERDESNFTYKYNVGFDTTYFQQRRASFEAGNDIASWSAQYQGEPIEREGTLFEPDGLMYYNGDLPEKNPDRIFTAVDPAFGGGDYTAAPIVYQYGKEFYVVDVAYDNGEKNITQPLLASKAKKWGLQAMQVEATKATRPYVEGIQAELDKINYHVTILTRSAPTHVAKEQRIFDRASDIRSYFYFLDTAHRTKEYNLFMQNMFSFKLTGKNKHDDAPDSMAMTAEMAFRNFDAKVEIMQRPF